MFQRKVVEKIKTHILFPITFFSQILPLRDNVKNYCRAWQATDDSITPRMRIACWITKAVNTHSEYATIFAFPLQQWLHERAAVLVTRTLPAIFCFDTTQIAV